MLHTITRKLLTLAACLFAVGLSGCGLSPAGEKKTDPGPNTQIRVGNNVPAGYVVNFQMPLGSVTLTSNQGKTVSLLPGAMMVEHTHLVGIEDVLTEVAIPAGTYTSADIVLQDAQLAYVDAYTQVVETDLPAPAKVSIKLNPPITINNKSSAIAISLDLSQTLNIDATQDAASLNAPVFTIRQEALPASLADVSRSQTALAAPRDEGGQAGPLGNVFGTVTSVDLGKGSFRLKNSGTGSTLTVYTDSGTVIDGATLGTLNGLQVEMEVITQTNGSLLAEEVEVLGNGAGAAVQGMATSVANMSVGSSVQSALGSGVTSAVRGKTVMVDVSTAVYKIDAAGVDMTGLPYTFERASFVGSQNVDLISSHALAPDDNGSAGLLQADTVELEPQTITGTVANVAIGSNGRATFDLMLPSDGSSPLSQLGPTTYQVYVVVQPSTSVSGDLTNGRQVSVRGLLFYNVQQAGSMVRAHASGGGSGQLASYEMVAAAIQ